jgi:hypothetical protein
MKDETEGTTKMIKTIYQGQTIEGSRLMEKISNISLTFPLTAFLQFLVPGMN